MPVNLKRQENNDCIRLENGEENVEREILNFEELTLIARLNKYTCQWSMK